MASPLNNFDFPHYPPPPPPPSPSDNGSTTVIVIVFVSFGGLLFLAFLAVALCCFIKKRKKMVQETDIVHVDERLKVKEAIVPGPHGPQAVVLSVEEDVHVGEEILKKEKSLEGMQAKSVEMASQEGGSNIHSRGHDDHLDHK
ncbi:protein TRACHEARY ELEMENT DIFFERENTIATION-RELATED 7-like [Diospyros lotus]|uniref:protein TRACHEARY ELEMENT DIFFERENTIATION-RELATED 7-like n=1 Tax=Diospyros lotus TaxID=55363 RepID=UPI00224ED748|nr:protein TRACHEARY ELEMENT DIFFERENTIATION-RELATED 7-like [Diospyros lotus]